MRESDEGKRMGISAVTQKLIDELCFYEREYSRIAYARPHDNIAERAAEDRKQDARDDLDSHILSLESRLREAERDTARLDELERQMKANDLFVPDKGGVFISATQKPFWTLREAADSSLSAPSTSPED